MDRVKLDLVKQAMKAYKKIYPCGTKSTLSECFTLYGNRVLFWFDTEDHSTHMMSASTDLRLAAE